MLLLLLHVAYEFLRLRENTAHHLAAILDQLLLVEDGALRFLRLHLLPASFCWDQLGFIYLGSLGQRSLVIFPAQPGGLYNNLTIDTRHFAVAVCQVQPHLLFLVQELVSEVVRARQGKRLSDNSWRDLRCLELEGVRLVEVVAIFWDYVENCLHYS